MCNNLVCKVCGGQGVPQRLHNMYSVTLCDDHFNELHCELQEKKPRKAMIEFHLRANLKSIVGFLSKEDDELGLEGAIEERMNNWMDAEHEYFLVTDGIVEGMIKKYKKFLKANPPPEPKSTE